MKKACIVGATGFGGCGLLEILARHSGIEVVALSARNETGFKIASMYPHLEGFYDLTVTTLEEMDLSGIDIAFLATPDRAGMTIIDTFFSRGIPVIDFSGDFRFNSADDYAVYAANKSIDTTHHAKERLASSVYGLCERNRDAIRSARIVGNPGCFAMSLILPLLPVTEHNIAISPRIICDSKSGVSGAGKNPGAANFYPQRYENINTYREGSHQHLVEVEQSIRTKDSSFSVFFVPQVLPMTRGILSNLYVEVDRSFTTGDALKLFRDYYSSEPFIRVTDTSPQLSSVRGTNMCVIRPLVDTRTGTMLVTSVIDNLMKGQSGNAVQCANIMLGIDETDGLNVPPSYP
ncbi:MAG: N-acetyl-gamma-glutamyl-phosphate reductase [Spirochaetota bacterium]